MNKVAILLSTYNGARYVRAQLQSLAEQNFSSFNVIIRDDGSSDSTLDIVKEFIEKYPNIFVLNPDDHGNLGVTRSFFYLLEQVNQYKYIMFCDQDDVWFQNKVRMFLLEIQKVERESLSEGPILVYGDMVVTNDRIEIIDKSFWNYQSIMVSKNADWREMLVGNRVTGSSLMINRAAVNVVIKYKTNYLLHDHNCNILVCKYGVAIPLAVPTMYYRQHGGNSEGARNFDVRYISKKILRFLSIDARKHVKISRHFEVSFPVYILLKISIGFKRFAAQRSRKFNDFECGLRRVKS